MCVPLPTVPCKCHSMPLQRRKRAQGQSAEAWGQSGCASKAVKTILYGWSLSNSLSQFNSCCMLKLKNKDNHWCLIILKLVHKRLFLCVLERRLGRRSNKGKSQQSDRIGQVWHTLLFIHCLSSAVLSSSVCAHTHTHTEFPLGAAFTAHMRLDDAQMSRAITGMSLQIHSPLFSV